MKLYRHFEGVGAELPGAVYAIGNFDGVHRGHRAVIEAARSVALGNAAPLGVLTFEPHPRRYFRPLSPPFRLTPFRSKMHQLQSLGCDLAVVLHFDAAFSRLTADAFTSDIIARGLKARHVVAGYDFVFGRGREGNAAMLGAAGGTLGFGVTIVAPAAGPDGEAFSSTQIRDCLARGDAAGATRLLGRPWEIEGRVEAGAALGRTMGFPTANLALGDYLRPCPGIYAASAGLEGADGVRWHDAVAYIGTRPAVDGGEIKLEVHLLDFAGDLYGRHMRVQMRDWIRPDQPFDGLAALAAQIQRDVAAARRFHQSRNADD